MSAASAGPLAPHAVARAAPQVAPRVAFQGERGAFGEEAVRARWGADAEAVPTADFDEVVRAVARGDVPYGLLPVENTLAGSVAAAWDALLAADVAERVTVIGATVLPIRHCLVALPGARLDDLVAVHSHPVALAQCRALFRRHRRLVPRPASDTAGAARAVAEWGDPTAGAIASRAAAHRYGLAVLDADVADRADNQTRFLAVAPASAAAAHAPPAGAPARTLLAAAVADVPGALVALLLPFADAGLDVGAPIARPTGEPWLHRFVVEVTHTAGDARAAHAMARAAGAARTVRALGTWVADRPADRPADAPHATGGPHAVA